MRFRLFVNCATTGYAFGMWQGMTTVWPVWAGVFVFLLLGTCLSMIDYARETHREGG